MEWYSCGATLTDTPNTRTCVGPYSSAMAADEYSRPFLFTNGKTTLLPTCLLNPFKETTLRWRYNATFGSNVAKVHITTPQEYSFM